jgi:hypothetical protein
MNCSHLRVLAEHGTDPGLIPQRRDGGSQGPVQPGIPQVPLCAYSLLIIGAYILDPQGGGISTCHLWGKNQRGKQEKIGDKR